MSNYINKSVENFFKVRRLDKYMTGHKGFIAGGIFKNLFTDTKFRDVDVFFEKQEDFNAALLYYKSQPEQFAFVYENPNAVCFRMIENKVKIELVRSHYGTVEETLRRFDFTVVKFAYFKETQNDETEFRCLFNETFFEDLQQKKLVIDESSSFPVNTFERAFKYRGYGFGLCRESKGKLIEMLQGASTDDLGNDLYFGFD